MNNVYMAELNGDDIDGVRDIYILQTLTQEPLPGFAIERRLERIHSLLELAAERKGKSQPGSLSAALRRLERAGWIEAEARQPDSDLEKLYSLTSKGREQLQAQLASWTSTLARFVDEGGLDGSFRRFLNRELQQGVKTGV